MSLLILVIIETLYQVQWAILVIFILAIRYIFAFLLAFDTIICIVIESITSLTEDIILYI